jgi:protein O-GlcNAc transferase
MQNNDSETALSHYQQALLHNPKDLDAQIMCGNLCVELGKFEEAAGYFRRVVRIVKSDDARRVLCYTLEQLGNAAQNAGNFAQAEACFTEALEHQPGNAIYWYNLGNAQRDLGKTKAALVSFQQSIQFSPSDADAHNNCGNVQRELGQLDKAIASYETALQLNPALHHALAHLVHQKQHICDWDGLDAQISQLRDWVKTEANAQISPFAFLAMPSTTMQEQKQCASNYANTAYAGLFALRETLGFTYKKANSKLKIGYLSADFRLHPLAFLITELIESHDRSQFEVIAYSYGFDDKTPARRRLEKAFDCFNDIRHLNEIDAAKKINQDGIDILVDLTGFTQTSRTGIVALKPAPISINWLGYPGTMGSLAREPLFDYIIADEIIAPNLSNSNHANFSEQLLYLPCYQPNDSQRPVTKSTQKHEHNLPEDSFVFCCFNQSFKITADVFATWLRILKQAPNAVLWLLDCNQWAKTNLQKAAENAGIAKNRLVFAPRVPIAEHLERHNHADLFLDTLPYNAHTTASDALFMRLPLLTLIGDTFASRVAASLLQRVNMPELITCNLQEYEQTALTLAHDPQKLVQLRQKLTTNIANSALFDPAKFVCDLEQEYVKLNKIYIEKLLASN